MQPAAPEDKRAHPFRSGHLATLAACAAVLLAVTFVKNGFRFTVPVNNARDTEVVSYERIRADVEQQLGYVNGEPAFDMAGIEKLQKQFSIIDPTSDAGLVLGLSTTSVPDLNLQSFDEVYGEDFLTQVPLLTTLPSSTPADWNAYLKAMQSDEIVDSVTDIMVTISGGGGERAEYIDAAVSNAIVTLQRVPVPAEFADYHKLLLVQYMEYGELAKAISQETSVPVNPSDGSDGENVLSNSAAISSRLLTLATRIQQEKNTVQARYAVTLP